MYPNIVLIGAEGAGKDTVAQFLFEEYGFQRHAFADSLRGIAHLNPQWSSLVQAHGYEKAKREFPEVREYLVNLGETIRSYEPDFFVRAMARDYDPTKGPAVITDCRYQNELNWAEQNHFRVLYLERDHKLHIPETISYTHTDPYVLKNNGRLKDLKYNLKTLIEAAHWATDESYTWDRKAVK